MKTVINALGLNNAQPKNPMPDDSPSFSIFWDQWLRFAITRDPNFDSLTFDPLKPGKWQTRLDEISVLMDKNKTDLSALAAKGGKILLLHGTADALITTRGSAYYYQRVQSTMGVSATRDFIRYYEIPGYNHGISAVFFPEWDSLTALENWVQAGIAPAAQIVRDAFGVPNRTRPLCEYPAWAKYNGSGEINSASSFTCVTQ